MKTEPPKLEVIDCRWLVSRDEAGVRCSSPRMRATPTRPSWGPAHLCTICEIKDHEPDPPAVVRETILPPPEPAPAPKIVRESWVTRTTACITQWRREEDLKRLVDALNKKWPDLRVDCQDTGGNISRGREMLAQRLKTPFYLMLEEDFLPTCATKIQLLADVLDSDPEIGAAGGFMMEPKRKGFANRGGKWLWNLDYTRQGEHTHLVAHRRKNRKTPAGVAYHPCEIILNFGLFRRELMEQVGFDHAIPIHEHSEWFYRAARETRWLMAYVPEVGIDHWRSRPDTQYISGRNRKFNSYFRMKHGTVFHQKRPPNWPLDRPNVVVLGVGRSNSSVVTSMINKLGWNVGPHEVQDDGFDDWEYTRLRDVNARYYKDRVNFLRYLKDDIEPRNLLDDLVEPWVIKDPRLRETLGEWIPLLSKYRPFLLYVTKNKEVTKQSLRNRGWAGGNKLVERRVANADEHFKNWPWGKLQISSEELTRAIALYDVGRNAYALEDNDERGSIITDLQQPS